MSRRGREDPCELILRIWPPNRARTGRSARDCGIRRHCAEPGLPAFAQQPDRQPLLQDEQVGRAEAEQNERMPVDAITQPAPKRERQITAERDLVAAVDAEGGAVLLQDGRTV